MKKKLRVVLKDKRQLISSPELRKCKTVERSQNLGVLPNSFTRGAGRMTGFLGEIGFELLFLRNMSGITATHDYLLGNRKIDEVEDLPR